MEYSRLPILPIPALLRRRLSRLYSSHRVMADHHQPGGTLRNGLTTLSEPHLSFQGQLLEPATTEAQRPSTGSDDLSSFDSASRGTSSPPVEEVSCSTKYEIESGLRWNRVVPAFNLLRNAGYEAQQPQADSRLARSLYISAVMYLLDALPSDLTSDETRMLQQRLPEPVIDAVRSSSPRDVAPLEGDVPPNSMQPQRSYLHRLLASSIVLIFLLVRLLAPYFKVLLRQVYEYERSHRITERIVTTTLDVADGLGKSSASISSAVCKMNEGKVGAAVGNLASWWIEGVAGGIYEGVGEGMRQLGLLKPGIEFDRVALPIEKR